MARSITFEEYVVLKCIELVKPPGHAFDWAQHVPMDLVEESEHQDTPDSPYTLALTVWGRIALEDYEHQQSR